MPNNGASLQLARRAVPKTRACPNLLLALCLKNIRSVDHHFIHSNHLYSQNNFKTTRQVAKPRTNVLSMPLALFDLPSRSHRDPESLRPLPESASPPITSEILRFTVASGG